MGLCAGEIVVVAAVYQVMFRGLHVVGEPDEVAQCSKVLEASMNHSATWVAHIAAYYGVPPSESKHIFRHIHLLGRRQPAVASGSPFVCDELLCVLELQQAFTFGHRLVAERRQHYRDILVLPKVQRARDLTVSCFAIC